MLGCKALESGQPLEFGHLFAGFRNRTGTLIAVGAIYLAASLVVMLVVGLTMGVGMAAMMGQGDPESVAAMGMTMVLAMLIMFALLLPVVMAIWLAAPLVVFHEQGAVEAMKGSFFGCLKNILPFLVYGVVGFVLMIVATHPPRARLAGPRAGARGVDLRVVQGHLPQAAALAGSASSARPRHSQARPASCTAQVMPSAQA